jgi:hypothetical protein
MTQMSGFVFGKKSMQKTMHQEELAKRSHNHQDPDLNAITFNERRASESLFSISSSYLNNDKIPNKTLIKSSMNTLNNSLSRSNSNGTQMSNSNKSFVMRKSEASRSYGRIVTKLQCRGCQIEYKPN